MRVYVDWTYGVDPRIVEYIKNAGVSEDRIKVVNETEVIILNNSKYVDAY